MNNNNFNIGTFNSNNAAVNLGGTVEGNQIGTQTNHAINPEIMIAIAELKALLTNLQQQYPNATASEAQTIINAELTEITQSHSPDSSRLATLRKQLFNPERHLKATKATLAEVAKHYLEESVFAKAAITYLDTMSADPGQGL